MRYAVLFPGQGSQFVGMGADLFAARPDLLGRRADDILGWSLERLCLEGPEEELTRTEVAQPALYALAYALWDLWSERVADVPAAAAGHSLGEYTALAASGRFSYEEGLQLVAARGQAMAAAARREPSGMAALVGADVDLAEGIAAQRRSMGGRLWVANINAPGQVVVAGAMDDIAWLQAEGSARGVRRVVPLKVAGAFHTPMMETAGPRLAEALSGVTFRAGSFPVWANTDASPHGSGVADGLLTQLTAPVRFSESMTAMAAAGVEMFVHVGPGDVTAGLARRSVADASVLVVNDVASVDEAAAAMGASIE